MLNDVGMVWKRRGESWMNRYKELQSFRSINGHLNVTADLNAGLFAWTRDQRSQLKKYQADPTQSSLTSNQVALLEQIGFEADLRESQWQTRMQELTIFKQTHGHTCVPAKYCFNQPLSSWWSGQQRQYSLLMKGEKSQLTQERANQLLDAGFDLKTEKKQKIKKTWPEMFADLREFKKEKGHLNVLDTSALGKWCQKQRNAVRLFHRGESLSLTRDQIEQLNSLGFDWGVTATPPMFDNNNGTIASWEEKFGELLTLRLETNSFEIPSNRQDLSDWVSEQRIAWARISQLEEVGLPFHATKKMTLKTWDDLYLELLKHRLAHGNFSVPINNRQLYDWCRNQRLTYKEMQESGEKNASQITIQRLSKLKRIHFPWDVNDNESLSVVRNTPIHGPVAPPAEKPSPLMEASLDVDDSTNHQYGPFFPLDLAPIAAPNDISWAASQPSPRYLHPALPAASLLGAQDAMMQLSDDDDHETERGGKSFSDPI